jgi:hypothetical protein
VLKINKFALEKKSKDQIPNSKSAPNSEFDPVAFGFSLLTFPLIQKSIHTVFLSTKPHPNCIIAIFSPILCGYLPFFKGKTHFTFVPEKTQIDYETYIERLLPCSGLLHPKALEACTPSPAHDGAFLGRRPRELKAKCQTKLTMK